MRTNLIKINVSRAFEGKIKDHCKEQKRERRVLVKFSFEPCRLINKFPETRQDLLLLKSFFFFFFLFSCFSWLLSQREANPNNYTAVLFLFPLPFIMEHCPSNSTLYWEESRQHYLDLWFSQLFLESWHLFYIILYIISYHTLFHIIYYSILYTVVVQCLIHVQLFATPWTIECQTPLSSTISWNLPMFMSTESMMLYNQSSSSPFAWRAGSI